MTRIRTLLLINGTLTAFYAVFLLFMPDKFFEMRGMTTDAFGLFITRLLGGPSQFGYAVLSIVASRMQIRETLRLVASVNFITWSLGGVLILFGKLTLDTNPFVWVDFAFAVVFSVAFASYVFSKAKE